MASCVKAEDTLPLVSAQDDLAAGDEIEPDDRSFIVDVNVKRKNVFNHKQDSSEKNIGSNENINDNNNGSFIKTNNNNNNNSNDDDNNKSDDNENDEEEKDGVRGKSPSERNPPSILKRRTDDNFASGNRKIPEGATGVTRLQSNDHSTNQDSTTQTNSARQQEQPRQQQQLPRNMNKIADDDPLARKQQKGNQQQQQQTPKKQASDANLARNDEATQTILRHGHHQFSQRDFEQHFYSKTFENIVSEVESAIRCGVKPELIKQGTSGSYFCRGANNEIVGVFKPKSEEPYGPNNPKIGKKIQRICCPCMFGRGCLLNHQGYLSEAGAYLVDQKLNLGIVPLTNVSWLASDSFNYSSSARNKALMKSEINRRYPAIGAKFHRLGLKPKIGSLQQFVRNYKDANIFLNECNDLKLLGEKDKYDFLEQFQRMVVLDYVIRNTDRGPTNWLVKSEAEFTSRSLRKNATLNCTEGLKEEEEERGEGVGRGGMMGGGGIYTNESRNNSAEENGSDKLLIPDDNESNGSIQRISTGDENPLQANESLNKTHSGGTQISWKDSLDEIEGEDCNFNAYTGPRRVFVAAIDNGLAFPFKHPDDWRGYPFHWAGFSFAKIPFFEGIKESLVQKLADMTFIEEIVEDLHGLFSLDKDFTLATFDRQMGVLRGQILNLTQALKEGKSPAELVQMDCLSVEKRYPVARRSTSFHGSTGGSIHTKTNLTEGYSYINQRKKPKCGCW